MNVNAAIHDYQVVNDTTAHVIAEITFDSESSVNPESVRDAIRTATKCKMNPVADTFVLREKGRTLHTVSGFVTLSKEVRTIPEGLSVEEATGFSAMSSNMFMDDNESLWELKSEDGRHLIRSHVENNMQEMEQLMASMSSCSFSSLSSTEIQCSKAIRQERQNIIGGDFVAFASAEGNVEQALVAASLADGEHAGKLLCVAGDGDFILDRNAVVMFVPGSQFQDKLDQPQMEMTASGAGPNPVQQLTEYYTRLFDYNHEYRDMLLARIKQHAYA